MIQRCQRPLSSFVQYQTDIGMRASFVDLGAVQGTDNVTDDEALPRRMDLANTRDVSERELFEAIGRAVLLPSQHQELDLSTTSLCLEYSPLCP